MSDELTPRITAVETTAAQGDNASELDCLAPAAAAALRPLADAVRRKNADHDTIVQALQNARVHDAFPDVLDAASEAVQDGMDDPFEFDDRLHGENLSAAASKIREVFRWL